MARLDLTVSVERSAIMLLLAACAACGSRSGTLNGLVGVGVSGGGSVDIGGAGGTTRRGCLPGQACLVDTDCTTLRCDAPNHRCGGSACNDHRQDGDESDIDCGGFDCGGCSSGQKCDTNFDCFGGCNRAIFPSPLQLTAAPADGRRRKIDHTASYRVHAFHSCRNASEESLGRQVVGV